MAATAMKATEAKLELPIEGMTCASCVRRVEKALSTMDGVQTADVNYALARATVTYDPVRTSPKVLAEAVASAGYVVPASESTIELGVIGMTCAACVRRVDKALRAVDGVRDANVNLVTHRATVTVDPSVTVDALASAIEKAGYEAIRDEMAKGAEDTRANAIEEAEDGEHRSLRRGFIVAAALTVPLLVVAMSHGLMAWTETSFGRWLQFALATPVILGPGRRFYRLAWAAATHRAADMNTLIAIGTAAAWLYSTVALVAPGLFPHATHGLVPHLYFEAAARC